jgi:hypothetical protein
MVKERRPRILSTIKKLDYNGSIEQLDFGNGYIGDRFTVMIRKADAAVTIGGAALGNEVIEEFTAGASAGRVNDTAGTA